MEDQLPTYQEAISTPDPFRLVAPYVNIHDYAILSRVSRRFCKIFAPMLYKNPMVLIGRLTAVGDPRRGEWSNLKLQPASCLLLWEWTFSDNSQQGEIGTQIS